jgi:peptidoglycan hydrolase-like protein with peptidoglycan-binding domain
MMAGGGSQWITLAQRCLAQILGPSVPQSGVMDSATRNAIQAFQSKSQLPVTGLLDDATLKGLQDACLSPGGAPAGSEPPAGADAGAAEPQGAADPGAAPAEPSPGGDAAAAGGAEPPPAGSEGELFLERHEGAAEQEFQVDGKMQVDLQWHEPVPLDKDDQFSWAPNTPGIYVIYVGGSPWYVGIAETSLRERFLHRRKALKDLQIPPTALAGRSVGWYALRSAAVPKGSIQRRAQNNPAAKFAPVYGKYSILRILEQYFIKQFKTATPKGNGVVEPVRFTAKGSLQILDKGARKASLAPNSQI